MNNSSSTNNISSPSIRSNSSSSGSSTGTSPPNQYSPLNNDSNLEEEDENQLHPIACFACRKGHRKCDRKLPACSFCKLKGKECKYPEPMKRGPPKTATITTNNNNNSSSQNSHDSNTSNNNRKNNVRHNPYPTTNNQKQTNNEIPVNIQTVDMYFDVLSLGCPVIQREIMLSIIQKKGINDNDNNNEKADELSLLYSIQAYCYQRLGKRKEAKESFQLARKYLTSVFDFINNFLIAGSFLYMSFYCLGEAEFGLSKYYLQSVQFYITQNRHTCQDNLNFIHLCKLVIYLQLVIEEEETLFLAERDTPFNVNSTDSYTLQAFHFKKMMDLFIYLTQHMSDGNCGKEINENNMMQESYELNLNNENSFSQEVAKNHLIFLEKTAKQFNRFHSKRQTNDLIKNSTKLMYLLVLDGLRLFILSKTKQSESLFIDTANRISRLSELNLFFYMPPFVCSLIANAAKVHLQVIKQIENGQRDVFDDGNDYFDLMRKDLRGLKLLSEKFSIVEKKYFKLVTEIEETLSRTDGKFINIISSNNTLTNNNNNMNNTLPHNIALNFNQQQLSGNQQQQQNIVGSFRELLVGSSTNMFGNISVPSSIISNNNNNLNDITQLGLNEIFQHPLNIHELPSNFDSNKDPFASVFSDQVDFDLVLKPVNNENFPAPSNNNYGSFDF
ncbi:hypothetical protein ABK040_003916 [Willaertia magna]